MRFWFVQMVDWQESEVGLREFIGLKLETRLVCVYVDVIMLDKGGIFQ